MVQENYQHLTCDLYDALASISVAAVKILNVEYKVYIIRSSWASKGALNLRKLPGAITIQLHRPL